MQPPYPPGGPGQPPHVQQQAWPQQPQQQQAWPQQQQPPQAWPGQPPPQAMVRRVSGVPLEPGERVLYFRTIDQMSGRIGRIFVGLLLTPFLIGLFLLYRVIAELPLEPDAQAITNKRLLSMKSDGKIITVLRWEEVTGFTKMLRRAADPNMAVNNAAGPQILFAEDGRQLEQLLPMWRQNPQLREQAPEIPFV